MTTAPPSRRQELTRLALTLLEADGPEAVSTRKLAAAYGSSTMAVYSEFGSLRGVVASVVDEGFAQLGEVLGAVPESDDPVADLVLHAAAYRGFARAHPHLYRVLYAVSALGGHRRTEQELMQGLGAFDVVHEVFRRAYRAGLMDVGTPYDATLHLWLSIHGMVLAELSGYLEAMPPPGDMLDVSVVRAAVLGFGGDPEATAASLAAATR